MFTELQYIAKTNIKIANWYENAKQDFNIDGVGLATIENDIITINYTENGINKTWSMCFYLENQMPLDYYFNVWMEEA